MQVASSPLGPPRAVRVGEPDSFAALELHDPGVVHDNLDRAEAETPKGRYQGADQRGIEPVAIRGRVGGGHTVPRLRCQTLPWWQAMCRSDAIVQVAIIE